MTYASIARGVRGGGQNGPGAPNLIHRHAAAMLGAGIHTEVFADCVRELNAVDFQRLVAEIRVPILFVNGGRDRGHMRFEARFAAAARSATTHRFEGAGHGVSILRSAEFAAVTADFAGRVFSARSL